VASSRFLLKVVELRLGRDYHAMSMETSPTLLKRLRNSDDRDAWERFVEIYSPVLYRWARRSGLADQDACDLLQDVFLLLFEKLPEFTYDPQKGRFRGWLRTVASNKLREKCRRRRETLVGENGALLERVDQDDASSFWDEEFQSDLIRRAMFVMQRDFETSTWKACWETAFRGRSAAEVADALGMSVGAVYVARSRVLRRLRRDLDGFLN
jgi:RNA polymerase sigma-70 factor, ECF subfamily